MEPTSDEKSINDSLKGKIIEIYWDGDKTYYPCVITACKGGSSVSVRYYGDGDEILDEDLSASKWRIWTGSDEEFMKKWEEQQKVSVERAISPEIAQY